jgi:ubiquinone/menaquinone biosynthesis C-methylase UbiE
LAAYRNCVRLFEAFADLAPLWQRTVLAAYVGIGPPVARFFGGNTRGVWEQADAILSDLYVVSGMSPQEIVTTLQYYMKLKSETDHQLSFDEAYERIYEQNFYPLVTHFTFAFQSSAIARLRFVKRIAAAITFTEARVADLGCGSGLILSEVLRLQPGWLGYGLDISSASITYARRLAIHKNVFNRANFHTGNISRLPFASGSLDLVIASEVIEHLPDPQTAFSEIARVLAPRGILVLTVPIESHAPAHIHSLRSAADLEALCCKAGLKIQNVSTKWHLTFGDDPRHLFAVAQLRGDQRRVDSVFSVLPPQISSAASRGIISS